MPNYIDYVIGSLIAVIGFFLVSLHTRFEEHLKASALADVEFGKLQVKQEETQRRVQEVKNKVDELGDKIDDLPLKVVELLRAVK
jgi:peptidoglycan hydrolase CwlO-like protein